MSMVVDQKTKLKLERTKEKKNKRWQRSYYLGAVTPMS
jgi:hypothetical protein